MLNPIVSKFLGGEKLNICPNCGSEVCVTLTVPKRQAAPMAAGWSKQTVSRLNASAASPWAPAPGALPADVASYERKQPAREPSVQGDVIVPMLQAALSGLAVGVPGAALMGMLGYSVGAALGTGAGLALGTVSVTWFVKLNIHGQLLWLIESMTGAELDQEKPEPAPILLEVDHKQAEGGQVMRQHLPKGVSADMFNLWAGQVLAGAKTPARANWIGAGQPFSRDQYDAFLSALESAGIVRDIDGKGRQLTPGGRRALARMINGAGGRAAAGNGSAPTFDYGQNGAGGPV